MSTPFWYTTVYATAALGASHASETAASSAIATNPVGAAGGVVSTIAVVSVLNQASPGCMFGGCVGPYQSTCATLGRPVPQPSWVTPNTTATGTLNGMS